MSTLRTRVVMRKEESKPYVVQLSTDGLMWFDLSAYALQVTAEHKADALFTKQREITLPIKPNDVLCSWKYPMGKINHRLDYLKK